MVLLDQFVQQSVQSVEHGVDGTLSLALLGQLSAIGHDDVRVVAVSSDQILDLIVVSFGRNLLVLIHVFQVLQTGERADVVEDLRVGVAEHRSNQGELPDQAVWGKGSNDQSV